MTIRIFTAIVFLILIFTSTLARPDWVNLTGAETSPNIAEIYVLDDHVKLVLEIYVGNLEAFDELIPDDWLKDSSIKRAPVEERLQNFADNKFQFITDTGEKLSANLILLEPRLRIDRKSRFAGKINPYTKQRIPEAPEDKRVLYVEINYPFKSKPETLTIIPPLDEEGRALVSIGFIAYHKSVPIIDFRYLGQTAKLNLDWQDPWYTKFDNKNLTRHHKYPLMLYLYVEPRQVRLESLMRISDIAELTGFNVEDFNASVEDKHQLLIKHIKNYYANKETLQIDGDSFKPDSIRVEFLNATLSGLKVIDVTTAVDKYSLLVGVSQQYLIETLPQKIESRWEFFNQRIDRIPVIVTDPVGPLQGLIDKDDPEFGWQNYLKKYSEPVIHPVEDETGWSISIPFIGEIKLFNQMPDQQEALSIVDGVLENVRIAFIEKEPGNFSRELGKVISAKQADVTKNELAKLFSPKVTGGAVGAVQAFNDVQIVNLQELNNPDGFSTTVNGSAKISARHWGHVDQRLIKFQILLDLIEVNKQWHLADLTVIDIKESK
ncbi:MAG: hypothetical protein DRQ48_10310 [Gammaproteobacteria bacterium]|nr:MAG: hypothetical protein DRQ58_06995 [Gammaproteobacteria bacterium]RKZ66964.1 MAG: hypothetical protein DRQ48_10310 [Gammaproteobacteria bacterium]